MKTVYARTLNPESFDYRVYDIREYECNEVIIDGGRHFESIDQKDYLKSIKKLISCYNSWDFDYYYKGSIMDFLRDYLPKKENGKKLSPKEAHNIKMSIENWTSNDLAEEDVICDCLSIITGKIYRSRDIRGYCQGDYAMAYYPVRNGIMNYVDWVEAWFFGTGIEVEIHDEDNEPTCAEEVCGYTFYTANWKTEDIIAEIKEQCGYKAEDEVEVKLWLYDKTRTIHIDEYKLATE